MAGADFKFVVRVFANARNEQFPYPAADELAHGVNPPVPAVEIANHAHALCIGSPDREVNAQVFTDLPSMRAEFFVEPPVLSLPEEVQIDFAHDHAVGIRIARNLFATVPAFDLEGVRNVARTFLQCGLEKTVALNFFRRNERAIVVELDRYLARIGTKHADQNVFAQAVRAENAKWIWVRALQKSAQLVSHKDGNVELFHRQRPTSIKKQDTEGECFSNPIL